MKFDSIVIGSGLSGLTAALILLKNGHRVAILEKDNKPGPLLRRFKREGYWCDVGLHYTGGFSPTSSLHTLFRYLGLWEQIHPVPMDLKAFDSILIGGKTFEIPSGLDSARSAYLNFFPKSSVAIHAYFDFIEDTLEKTPYVNFDMAFDQFSTEFKSDETLEAFLKKHNAEDEMIHLAGRHAFALCGIEAHEIPLYYHALILGPFYRGACTFNRGGDEILDAFTAALKSEGAEIFCSQQVDKIELSDKRTFQGLTTVDGKRFESGSCIFTGHPQLLNDMLPRGIVKPAFFNRLKGLTNTKAPFVVWLKAETIPRRLRSTNYYRLGRWEKKEDMFAVMACDSGHSDRKALCLISLASDGCPGKDEYENRTSNPAYYNCKNIQIKKSLALFEKMFPEMKGEYSVIDAATPHTFERYTGTVNGSAYGVKHISAQRGLTPIISARGLYLSGQSIHFPGIMGTIISGFLTTSMILGLEKLWDQVRQYQ
ncbi:MAG: NAD(P)/FAD-dependent oxidoreductase [Desulfobacterales bacterium]|nr:NAD(P)/FAD-dependent oxidoreductase [Desulfobacterales bacterium]